ncbi:MAG TPA: hypothetical protein VK762_04915 [Polyangiaceae bacterium]|nr:hypothetical protein [Polyangiaceae bacterium]
MGRSIAIWAALLASAIPTTANARPSARLVYSRAAGAESCPDERALRAAVAERVGYDPFFAWVKQAVVASMAPDGRRGFVARIRLVDEQGIEAGTRDLHADGACADLLDTAALAIAIAIDPQSLTPRPVARRGSPVARRLHRPRGSHRRPRRFGTRPGRRPRLEPADRGDARALRSRGTTLRLRPRPGGADQGFRRDKLDGSIAGLSQSPLNAHFTRSP